MRIDLSPQPRGGRARIGERCGLHRGLGVTWSRCPLLQCGIPLGIDPARPPGAEGLGEDPKARLARHLGLLPGELALPFPVAQEQGHPGRGPCLGGIGKDLRVGPGACQALMVAREPERIDPLGETVHECRRGRERMTDLHGPIAAKRAKALGQRL